LPPLSSSDEEEEECFFDPQETPTTPKWPSALAIPKAPPKRRAGSDLYDQSLDSLEKATKSAKNDLLPT